MAPPSPNETSSPIGRARGRPFLAAGALLALLTVVLIATNVWLAVRSYKSEWDQVTSASRNLSHSVANQLDSVFSEVDRLLHTLDYMVESEDLAPAAIAGLQPIMVTYLSRAEYLHGLFVYGADGSWLVHTMPEQGPKASNADRDYFKAHRSSQSDCVRIGAPIVSRSTEELVIPVSKRLDSSNGDFPGVALATVKVETILKLLNAFDVGTKGAISLNLNTGVIVTRRPFVVSDLGRQIPNSPLTPLLQHPRSGSITLHSPIDGVERLVLFDQLPNSPLFVTVALSKEEILKRWRQGAQVQFLCVLLLVSVIGLSGWYVFRSMRQRQASDLALSRAHAEVLHANEQLAHMAEHDALTGLPNRRAFDKRLLETMALCRRNNRPVSILMFDVDYFKMFNHEYGHPAGDDCLRRVANALSASLRRPGDFIARYGGEEFVAILGDTDAAGAAFVASTAASQVQGLLFRHARGVGGRVTVSCGVAACDWQGDGETPSGLLKKADLALYRAKELGRNRVELAA